MLLVAIARVDYRVWQRLAWPVLLVTIVLLIIPLLPFTYGIAPLINGARRWVQIGPLRLQPSELARLAVVIWCAMLAARKGEAVRGFKKGVLPFLVGMGALSGLIVLEPNMSMATLVALLRRDGALLGGRQARSLHAARPRGNAARGAGGHHGAVPDEARARLHRSRTRWAPTPITRSTSRSSA